MFDDDPEAWRYGPVSRAVYDKFKRFGRSLIQIPSGPGTDDAFALKIVDDIAGTYGIMSAFDLVEFSHREGGAWSMVYSPSADNPIRVSDIIASKDIEGFPGLAGTAADAIERVASSIPNALDLLRNS